MFIRISSVAKFFYHKKRKRVAVGRPQHTRRIGADHHVARGFGPAKKQELWAGFLTRPRFPDRSLIKPVHEDMHPPIRKKLLRNTLTRALDRVL